MARLSGLQNTGKVDLPQVVTNPSTYYRVQRNVNVIDVTNQPEAPKQV